MSLHRLVLQQLNRVLNNFGAPVFYPKATFECVDYTDKPIILWEGEGSPEHPDFDGITRGVLPKGYRIVGRICNTSIDGDTQRADADITDDALSTEISEHPDQFAISTGFWGKIIDNVMRDVVAPNHVLLFRRGGVSGGNPNDVFSQVCNTEDHSIYPVSLDTGVKIMTEEIQQPQRVAEVQPQQVGNVPDSEPDIDIESQNNEEEDELATLREENAQLKALAEQLVTQMQEIQQVFAEAKQAQQQQQTAPPVVPPTEPVNPMPQPPMMPPAPQAMPQQPPVPPYQQIGNVATLQARIENLEKRCTDYERERAERKWSEVQNKLPAAMRGSNARAEYERDPTGFLMRAITANTAAPQAVGNTAAEGERIAKPHAEKIQTFATSDYAYARQIGNVAAPTQALEGARLGPHLWQLYGGMKLDSRSIDSHIALKRFGDKYGGI